MGRGSPWCYLTIFSNHTKPLIFAGLHHNFTYLLRQGHNWAALAIPKRIWLVYKFHVMFELYECHWIDKRGLFTCSLDLVGSHGNMEDILFETCWECEQPTREENTKETQAQFAMTRMTRMRKIMLPLCASIACFCFKSRDFQVKKWHNFYFVNPLMALNFEIGHLYDIIWVVV